MGIFSDESEYPNTLPAFQKAKLMYNSLSSYKQYANFSVPGRRNSMGKTFECPTCGAPLDYDGAKTTQRCPYCNNSVIVPEELHPDSVVEHASGTSLNGAKPGLSYSTLEQLKEVKALIESGKKSRQLRYTGRSPVWGWWKPNRPLMTWKQASPLKSTSLLPQSA
jgi:DNA-directed RNA polymerase subunit RPC12/RpoP